MKGAEDFSLLASFFRIDWEQKVISEHTNIITIQIEPLVVERSEIIELRWNKN